VDEEGPGHLMISGKAQRVWSLVKKESRQVVRDPSTWTLPVPGDSPKQQQG
jgi:hypothetical protein